MLEKFLAMLATAGAASVDDGPLLSNWTRSELTGDADNEVLRFAWHDANFRYSYKLTEGGIAQGKFDPATQKFIFEDAEGDMVRIQLFTLTVMTPQD